MQDRKITALQDCYTNQIIFKASGRAHGRHLTFEFIFSLNECLLTLAVSSNTIGTCNIQMTKKRTPLLSSLIYIYIYLMAEVDSFHVYPLWPSMEHVFLKTFLSQLNRLSSWVHASLATCTPAFITVTWITLIPCYSFIWQIQ